VRQGLTLPQFWIQLAPFGHVSSFRRVVRLHRMRLPSDLLLKLALVGLAACEPAHQPACKPTEQVIDSPPLGEVVRMTPEPAVAPRYPQPQPQQQQQPQPQPQPKPQPVVKTKPKPHRVWTSICGAAPQLVDARDVMVECGKG
jgi:outer membrane biosynthesis protein TonB